MIFARYRADTHQGGGGVERQAASAITTTVRGCLDECRVSPSPLASLAATVERLRTEHWHEADIRQVQAIVHKLLVAVVIGEQGEHSQIDVPVAEPELSDDARSARAGD